MHHIHPTGSTPISQSANTNTTDVTGLVNKKPAELLPTNQTAQNLADRYLDVQQPSKEMEAVAMGPVDTDDNNFVNYVQREDFEFVPCEENDNPSADIQEIGISKSKSTYLGPIEAVTQALQVVFDANIDGDED